MSTVSWATRIRCDSDATFQEWRDELITKLGVLVTATKLAADETNITPAVGTRTANTEQGYAVYHIADSLHGTAPIYIRFGFGCGSATNVPRLQITTGTSTNGAGVLGGTALSTILGINILAAQTTDTSRNSYMCANSGFFGMSWKQGSNADGTFFICRTCDSTGAATVTGAIAAWGPTANTGAWGRTQGFRFAATAAAYTAQTSNVAQVFGFFPQAPISTLSGSNIQVAVGWMGVPAVVPIFGIAGVLDAEVSAGSTFTVALVGSTTRTYLALPFVTTGHANFGPGLPTTGVSTPAYPKMAFLWD